MEYLVKYPSFNLDYRKRPKNPRGLDGYCDSDWGNSSSRRSTTGNIFRYNGDPIHWKTKLQKTIALSTAEAEYYAASTAAVEVIYLRIDSDRSSGIWDPHRRVTRQSMRTTMRVSNGATM